MIRYVRLILSPYIRVPIQMPRTAIKRIVATPSAKLFSFGFTGTFLPFLRWYYPATRFPIKIISNPTDKGAITMPAHNAVITIKTEESPDLASLMIMINNRTNVGRPITEAYRAMSLIQFIILFLRQPIDPFNPRPSRPVLLLL